MQQDEFFSLLDRTSAETLAQARSFSTEALNTAPEGCWTPLQVLEHICLTEALITSLLQRPSEEQHDNPEVYGASKLRHLIVGKRDIKRTAPDRLQPGGELLSLAGFEERFTRQRETLKAAISGGALPIDRRLFPHPALGNMTVSDWLYFLVNHTERHVEQLKEIASIATA
ncbi:DinB family protein [Flaviaesturariibacter flavus]|uniref:DinB family protein n=1 Tax=Flaviaesturariibacter flavus TaxID=2502780 RepID=A0A4R1BAI6_9BACT|nr:DinB family protein [Flaviaesturariibacter flavus]TCJ13975.1 DinB family protein [Flaviaesturariibacter flavus]